MSDLPRGIRNNNPGNIRLGADWQGRAAEQTDAAFIQFKAPEWGVRAMVRILRTYENRGLKTVRQIIDRWAPPNENDTESYVQAVAKAVGVMPSEPLTHAHLPALLKAIIAHENGQQPYTDEQIAEGIALA